MLGKHADILEGRVDNLGLVKPLLLRFELSTELIAKASRAGAKQVINAARQVLALLLVSLFLLLIRHCLTLI